MLYRGMKLHKPCRRPWGLLTALIVLCALGTAFAREQRQDLLKNAKAEVALVSAKGGEPEWTQEKVTYKKAGELLVRYSFSVDAIPGCACLEIHSAVPMIEWKLNGQPVAAPLEGVQYKTLPAVPTRQIKTGKNVLTGKFKAPAKSQQFAAASVEGQMLCLAPEDVAFAGGPVLGWASAHSFSVTCRTNMPAQVTLKASERSLTSQTGFFHTFNMESLKQDTEYSYTLKAGAATCGPFTVKTYPEGGKLAFVALGDSRTLPAIWEKISKTASATRPAFVVSNGDLVENGLLDHLWIEQFIGPAAHMLATCPFYSVLGNHERDSPLFVRLLATPDGKENFAQEIGPILMIGLNGTENLKPGSELGGWLEKQLSQTKAKFIFLVTHYPAWSSGQHGAGKKDEPDEASEAPVRAAREYIMPLLKKYNATAMIAGHDHCYERSEPDQGVTLIITGGAGAPLYKKTEAAGKQNPYSKVFFSENNYCIFTIDGDVCSMKALDLDGKVIDEKTWKARK